jgi:hypothetical protein
VTGHRPAERRATASYRLKETRMTLRTRIGVAIVWVLSLVVIGGLVSAQQQTRRDPAPVIFGSDIGFQPEGWRGNARTGKFVIRINGQWVDAVEPMKPKPATTQ